MRKIWLPFLFGAALCVGTGSAEVVVRVGPPRPRIERRLVRPGAGYAWVGGFHRWDGRAYVWVPGRWELPPRERAVWIAPRWERRRYGYRFVDGRWR